MPATIWIFAVYPALATFVSFQIEVMPHLLYPLFKVIMFLIPFLVWRKQPGGMRAIPEKAGLKKPNIIAGPATGLLLGGIILSAFVLIFKENTDTSVLQAKLISLDIVDHYWSVALFIALCNSALEEWYWRGFMLDQLKIGTESVLIMAGLNGFLFGLHHFFTLICYFPIGLSLGFTFGTMAAGAVWAFFRLKGMSLFDCYMSHIIADMTILWIGWEMIKGY